MFLGTPIKKCQASKRLDSAEEKLRSMDQRTLSEIF